jgi:FtsP/CotA-like multicopper oxidase with cupredoxin domain
VQNTLGVTLLVRGLCEPGPVCEPLAVVSGGVAERQFVARHAGTYHYWASTTDAPLAQRDEIDSQLGGAIIVDASDSHRLDRVFVITRIDRASTLNRHTGVDRELVTLNGRSWPLTPKLDHAVGDDVRWRVINLSDESHAMHLHGFYFQVTSVGDGRVDRIYADGDRRLSVTEAVPPGGTFTMSWVPERPGNWLFHCHMTAHMSNGTAHAAHESGADPAAGMAGLVVGVRVSGGSRHDPPPAAARAFTMHLQQENGRYGNVPGFRVEFEGTDTLRLNAGPVPGPVLVLTRGEPVAVSIRNQSEQPSAIHWHGIELDSYFDGVPGWSGIGTSMTPPIAPGGSFVARFTPPRAGTFIYHTHWHDVAQLAGGLYGALIVLEPGQKYDFQRDHVFIIGLDGAVVAGRREPFALNGRSAPEAVAVQKGVPHRFRLINITPNNVGLTFFLLQGPEPVEWRAIAKDGADLPPSQATTRRAVQLVSVGETYDFEWTPSRAGNAWLEVRRANGEWVIQAPLTVQ